MKTLFAFILVNFFFSQAFASSVQMIAEANVGETVGKIDGSIGVCGLWIQKDAHGQQGYDFGLYRKTSSGKVRYQSTFVAYDTTEPNWTLEIGKLTFEQRANDPYDFELYVIFRFDPTTLVINGFELPDEKINCTLN